MSLCLDCNVFTIKGKSVSENKYISIFNIWLSLCMKNAGLGPSDIIHIKMDSDTYDYCKNNMVFTALVHYNAVCPIQILLYPSPETILDGMMMRYARIDYVQDIYMYCDIDILILKSLRILYEGIRPNTIRTHVEGRLHDLNYGACFTSEELAPISQNAPGFSSGKFIIHGKELYQHLMNMIGSIYKKDSTYFTVDQPFYNKALYALNNDKYTMDLINMRHLSTNGSNYNEDTVLLDAMGMPGDGEMHYDKIINYYVLIQSNLLDKVFTHHKA